MKKQKVKALSLKRNTVSNFKSMTVKGGVSGGTCDVSCNCVGITVGCPEPSIVRTNCCLSYQLSCICN
ncbi:hypothetical protein [Kordia jejudonensis]|uniref:hypothetical protein n=1 Tax=Kordia jejudonensis TaxID=1348245 RepID=UPI0012E04472|nr:hypothetical protein [Kordia jejudonensis]